MVCVGERRRRTIPVGDVARKRAVTVVGHRDRSLGGGIGIDVARGSGISLTDGIGVCFAHVGQTILNGPEVHRTVGAVARGNHDVTGLVQHVERKLFSLELAPLEHLRGTEVRLTGGVIRIGEARSGGAFLAGTNRTRGTRRIGLLEACGLSLGHLVGGLGGNAGNRCRLAPAQFNGIAVAHLARGNLRACRIGHRVGERAALGLALGGGQRQLKRELLLCAHVRGTLYGLADLERTVRVVRVGYIRAGNARHVALVVGVLAYLVCNLYAMVAILGQTTEAVAPSIGILCLDGLALGKFAIGVEVNLDLLGSLARSIVSIVPDLAAGDLHRLGLMLVGDRELVAGTAGVQSDIRQIALNRIFFNAVGDSFALIVEHAQAAIGPKVCLPVVGIAQNRAPARVLPVGVQVHRHALRTLAVTIVAIGPCLLDRYAKGLKAHLGILLADHLVGRIHTGIADCRATKNGTIVGMGAAGKAGFALAFCKIGVEPLAMRSRILLQVLYPGRAHTNGKRCRIALAHHKVTAVGLLGRIDGDGGHLVKAACIRFRRCPDRTVR